MDFEKYASTEVAYKNGYKQGYEDCRRESNRWIPVTEQYPKKNGRYVCRYIFNEDHIMHFEQVLDYYATDKNPHFQHEGADMSMRVTHWAYLPAE